MNESNETPVQSITSGAAKVAPAPAPMTAPQRLEYAPPQPTARRWGTGFLPAAASLYLPGLGHFIAGRRRAAAGWLVAYVALALLTFLAAGLPALTPGLVVIVPLLVVLPLACAVHAFRNGVRCGGRMLGRAPLRYLAGAGLLVAAGLKIHPMVPLASLVRDHWAEAFVVPTAGMDPAIQAGDRILAQKRIDVVRRWDLIVFDSLESPGQRFVQRVVGLPGETIELIDGEVTVNGSVVPRPPGVGPYAKVRYGGRRLPEGGNAAEGRPLTLGPDEYFMLGDNSPVSLDSRYWTVPAPGGQAGALPADRIVGRVTTIYWPVARWRMFR